MGRFSMLSSEVKNVSRTLGIMAELEQVISEFYRSAGDRWPEDGDFWSGLAEAETTHAGYLGRMRAMLDSRPEAFEIGRPIALSAVAEVLSGVRNLIRRLKNGEFSRKAILLLSRDLEQSVLESKYMEMLKTEDRDYQKMISEIVLQTEAHQQQLLRKIAETR